MKSIIAAYLTGFSKRIRMEFFFLEYLFSLFLYYANEESDDIIYSST